MKQAFTLLLRGFGGQAILLCLLHLNASAQQSCDSLVFQIKTPFGITTYPYGECGYTVPTWSAPIKGEFCLPIVWAYDITPDSLCCDSIPEGSLLGKAALIRRGGCELGTKAYRSDRAGASAAIIINHYNNLLDNGCTPLGASGTDDPLIFIPTFLLCRNAGEQIDAALKAGGSVELCITRASLRCPTAEYSYAIPASQAAPMDLISVLYKNRTALPQTGVLCKADIIDPNGKVTPLAVDLGNVKAGEEILVHFPAYDAPAIIGKFRAVYTSNQFAEPTDTLAREFVHTKYTYATDNLKVGGSIGWIECVFNSVKYYTGSIVRTGSNGFTASYASFGIGNAQEVLAASPEANVINVLLFDNDPDNDGEANLESEFSDMLPVAYGEYTFNGKERYDSLLYVALTPIEIGQLTLKANHLYLISILYDGAMANIGKFPFFSHSAKVHYPETPRVRYHTPLYPGWLYAGWENATVVTRLHGEGFTPDPLNDLFLYGHSSAQQNPRLAAVKYHVSPNPANDALRLHLQLAGPNKSVAATLIDFQGHAVATQVARDFQSGQLTFDATKLPSGAYSLWIRSSDEGSTMAKVMICH